MALLFSRSKIHQHTHRHSTASLPFHLTYPLTHPSHTQCKHTHAWSIYSSHTSTFLTSPPPHADSISVLSRRKNVFPPLLPYHGNNAAECRDTASLSAAPRYTKADTFPHIGTQTRPTRLIQLRWIKSLARWCIDDLYPTWAFICVPAACRCVRRRTRHLTPGCKL